MSQPSPKRIKLNQDQRGANDLEWVSVECAFKNRICTGEIFNRSGFKDPLYFLDACFPVINNRVRNVNRPLKINFVLICSFVLPKSGAVQEMCINTKNVEILPSEIDSDWYSTKIEKKLLKKLEAFQQRDSGWALRDIVKLRVNVNENRGFHGGRYRKLPKVIANKNAVINVRSKDNACFKWAILAGLYPVNIHPERASAYVSHANKLNFDNIPFPTELKHVHIFEKQNENVSVNVYGIQYSDYQWMVVSDGDDDDDDDDDDEVEEEEEKERKKQRGRCGRNKKGKNFQVVPLHVTKYHREKHVNLLMLQVKNTDIYHFYYIKNLSRLAHYSITRHNKSIVVCHRCLCYFHSKEKLDVHLTDCVQFKPVSSVMPSGDKQYVKFSNFRSKLKLPFIIYADTECMLEPVATCSRSINSNQVHLHTPFSIAYYIHCTYNDEYSEFKLYRGRDCMDWFTQQLYAIADIVNGFLARNKEMIINAEEELAFRSARNCHICEKPFQEDDVKHRDHCHFTGVYRGAAHAGCNVNYRPCFTVPVVFHNLTNYDGHFLMRSICQKTVFVDDNDNDNNDDEKITLNPGPVSILPSNMEKYKSFTKSIPVMHRGRRCSIYFRFMDSLNFLTCSLEKCASYLKPEDLKIIRKYFPNDQEFNLVNQKGIFPYEYVSNESVLLEDHLPSIDNFKSLLTGGRTVSESDYKRACDVWHLFKCKTLGEYSDLYLKIDVLLLSDVFENFRNLCIKTYELDPAHYVTSPGLAWDALLKTSKIELQLITDIEQLQFIERGIRGGIVHCSCRHAVANNRFMSNYNANIDESYIIYLDVNSLYSWAMMQHLPVSDFTWIDSKTLLDTFDVTTVPDDSDVGYILEVDLEYPENIHDLHSDLPLCPEKILPPSPPPPTTTTTTTTTDCNSTKSSAPKKLISTLYDKKNYVIHYRNLKQCLQHKLQLRKIHRILSFKQAPWMKPYIVINTEKRMRASNDFEKNFFKLMNNSVFGKTMQNVRKMVDIKLATRWGGRYGAAALIAKPNFKRSVIFNENLVGIELNKVNVVFDKPIAVGMSILDISKTLLIEFHYNYILNKFPANHVKLCYTDTDSLIYHIKTSNIYEDIKIDVHKWFDTSGYPVDNKYNLPIVNKRVVGLLKDELNGDPITEFIGLRAKMYALETESQRVMRRAKGVKQSSVNELTIDDYRNCVLNSDVKSITQYFIQSKSHVVYTIEQHKLGLSAQDDKRFILTDKINTLAWGHYRLKKYDDS
ncbi:uncharacterized protein LOC126106833 [Schistocerca cancellata]|uniref:uncharacterized protein LOC126106833 n=1 Tax=Schistocerca cancellata TaxID=274614 RepID=UPI0021193E57|nr:uncharacterized protein LOC126106833 [Schistocerca cancellata]XP_049769188.1 uncharacterized protein LOC126106833 [Schistocerca cancellata]